MILMYQLKQDMNNNELFYQRLKRYRKFYKIYDWNNEHIFWIIIKGKNFFQFLY